MSTGQNNPESKQDAIAKDLQREQPQVPTEEATDEETKTILNKFVTLKSAKVEKTDDAIASRMSRDAIGDVGYRDLEMAKEKQGNVVRKIYADAIDKFKDYQKKSFANDAASKNARNAYATELMNAADIAAELHIGSIQAVLDKSRKGDLISESEAVTLKQRLAALEKLTLSDSTGKNTQEIILKLRKKEALSDPDYDHIISIINPHADFNAKTAKDAETFEATSAGLLIGSMTPIQRSVLMQKFMESPKKMETFKVLDGFVRSDVISIAKAKELFDEASQKKPPAITPEDYKKAMESFRSGEYAKDLEKFREAIKKEMTRMQGKFSHNMMNQLIGGPLIGGGMVLYSAFLVLTNMLASGGDFGEMAKNPYIWGGVGVALLGTQVVSGSLKTGPSSMGFEAGWMTPVFKRMFADGIEVTTPQKIAYENIAKIYLGYAGAGNDGSDKNFGFYLKHGGVGTMIKLRKDKLEKKQSPQISVAELEAFENDESLKAVLHDSGQKFPDKTAKEINMIAETVVNVLHMQNQQDFNSKLAYIEEDQGMKTNTSVASSAPETPAPQVIAANTATPSTQPKNL